MRKEELRKLRALPATKEMMEKGKLVIEEYGTAYNGRKWTKERPKYNFLMRVQNLNGFIKAAVFLPEDIKKDIRTPRYEIFINKVGEEWITRELDADGKEVAWRESMLINLEGIDIYGYYSFSKVKVFMSADAKRTLGSLEIKNDKDSKGPWRLYEWQKECRGREIARKEAREQAPWDADMKLVPKITPGFLEWMRKDVCRNVYIIYDYKKSGAKVGFCSRCKKMVPIKNPRHDGETRCPSCRAKAVFKASGKIKTLRTEDYEAEIIQKIPGGIVIRTFRQWQNYRVKDYRKPNLFTHEYERTLILEDGSVRHYEWGSYKNKFHRWIPDKNYFPYRRTSYWNIRIKLYKKNLAQLKKSTFLKHSAIDLWDTLPTSVTNYLKIEKSNPAVEMLARIGMFRMAKGLMEEPYDSRLLKQDETEISKMLKIDKARLKRLKEMDANVYALRWMQFEKLHNTIWSDEMIQSFGNDLIGTEDLNFLPIPIKFPACYNYLKKQAAVMDDTLHQTMITWMDYINMADQMKMNTNVEQIMKPKNLKEAHDRLVMINKSKGLEKQAAGLEKKWPKVNKQLEKLQKFEFENNDFCILAPKKVLDIVTEGVILGHCVHTCDYYFSRIQTDESYLFFLRKKCSPDMPWYTLEVEPSGNIRQKRTTGDKQNADFNKAIPFLKKWQQYFKKQLTKEEEKLGEKANLLRKENYKKLREDGNKVWHGPLAGKLLADVLEADFMEAM